MISKLTAQGNNQNKQFQPKIYQGTGECRQRVTMIEVITKIDTDLTVVIGECHLGVELSMDKIIEEGCNMLTIIEITSGEEILGRNKIIKVTILEVDIGTIIETTHLEEVEVGLGKDNIQ